MSVRVFLLGGFFFLFSSQIFCFPIRMTDCIQLALSNNPDIRMAESRFDQARFVSSRQDSALYPQVGFDADHISNHLAGSNRLSYQNTVVPNDNFFAKPSEANRMKLSVQQVLFSPGYDGRKHAAETDIEIRRAELDKARVQVVAQVIVQFYDYVRYSVLAGVEQQRIGVLSEQLIEQQNKLAYKLDTSEDLLKTRYEIGKAESTVQAYRSKTALAKNTVALLLDVEDDSLQLSNFVQDPDPAEWDAGRIKTLLHSSQDGHPDLAVAAKTLERQSAAVDALSAGWLPTCTASGYYGYTAANGFIIKPENQDYSVSVQMNLPLFDGFGRSNQIAENKAKQEEATWALKSAQNQVKLGITQAQGDLIDKRRVYEETKSLLIFTQEQVDSTREKHVRQYATKLEFLQTKLRFLDAMAAQDSAKYDLLISLAKLKLSLGQIPNFKVGGSE